jgi:hypothetical protein
MNQTVARKRNAMINSTSICAPRDHVRSTAAVLRGGLSHAEHVEDVVTVIMK